MFVKPPSHSATPIVNPRRRFVTRTYIYARTYIRMYIHTCLRMYVHTYVCTYLLTLNVGCCPQVRHSRACPTMVPPSIYSLCNSTLWAIMSLNEEGSRYCLYQPTFICLSHPAPFTSTLQFYSTCFVRVPTTHACFTTHFGDHYMYLSLGQLTLAVSE